MNGAIRQLEVVNKSLGWKIQYQLTMNHRKTSFRPRSQVEQMAIKINSDLLYFWKNKKSPDEEKLQYLSFWVSAGFVSVLLVPFTMSIISPVIFICSFYSVTGVIFFLKLLWSAEKSTSQKFVYGLGIILVAIFLAAGAMTCSFLYAFKDYKG